MIRYSLGWHFRELYTYQCHERIDKARGEPVEGPAMSLSNGCRRAAEWPAVSNAEWPAVSFTLSMSKGRRTACHELVEWLTKGPRKYRLLANLWLYGPAGWHRVGIKPPGAFFWSFLLG